MSREAIGGAGGSLLKFCRRVALAASLVLVLRPASLYDHDNEMLSVVAGGQMLLPVHSSFVQACMQSTQRR